MKKELILPFIFIVLIFNNSALSYESINSLVIFPIDEQVNGSASSIDPNILKIISYDINNFLLKKPGLNIIDTEFVNSLPGNSKLAQIHHKLLTEYKSDYKLDYESLSFLCEQIKANRVLLISGDFDLQNYFLKRKFRYFAKVPIGRETKPVYKLYITATLVDPQSGLILWEKLYSKYFPVENFKFPTTHSRENVTVSYKLKSFSRKISKKISSNVYKKIIKNPAKDTRSKIVIYHKKYSKEVNEKNENEVTVNHIKSPSKNEKILNNLPSSKAQNEIKVIDSKKSRKNSFKKWIKRSFRL